MAAAPTLICLVVLELALRIHTAAAFNGTLEEAYERSAIPLPGKTVTLGEIVRPSPDPRIIYQLKPELDVVFEGAVVRTNSGGWREEEIASAKPPGTVRIVGIGDSHMFGWGVGVRERYMDRIAERLNRDHPERDWQSVVLAAPGYNAQMEVAALERFGLQYRPDLIVYGMVLNDHCLPNFVRAGSPAWGFRSFIFDYARRVVTGTAPRARDGEGLLIGSYHDTSLHEICKPDQAPPEYRELVGRRGMLGALGALARLGERRDTPVIVLVTLRDSDPRTQLGERIARLRKRLPWLRTFHFEAEVAAWLAHAGYENYLDSPLARSAADPHPSVTGHALKARLFVERLDQTGLTRLLIDRSR